MRRLVASCIALGLMLTGCTGSPSPTSTEVQGPGRAAPHAEPLVLFDSGYLSFLHPESWQEATYPFWSTMSEPIVYLSNERLHEPCTQRKSGLGLMINCGLPIDQLGFGGVLVTWTAWGRPPIVDPSSFTQLPGDLSVISGHLAKIYVGGGGGQCSRLGAELSVVANFYLHPANGLNLSACIRGPGLDAARDQVLALIHSTRIADFGSSELTLRALPH